MMNLQLKLIYVTVANLRELYQCGNNEQLCIMAYSTDSLIEIKPVVKLTFVKPRLRNPLTEDQIKYISENNTTKSVSMIATYLQRDKATVHNYMRRHGIKKYTRKQVIDLKKTSVSETEPIDSNGYFNVDMVGEKTWIV